MIPARHEKRIKLFIASPLIYPPRGGAERRFWRYLPGLRKRSLDISIVSGTPKAKKLTEEDKRSDWYRYMPGQTIPVPPVQGTTVHQIRLPDKKGWHRTSIFFKYLLKLCREESIQPHVIQLLTPLPWQALPWLIRLRHLNIGLIYSITLAPRRPGSVWAIVKRGLFQKLLFAQLDRLIVSSEVIADLVRGSIDERRIAIIPNGVNIDRFKPATPEQKFKIRRELGFNPDSEIILNVGAIHPRKRPELLLEAWHLVATKRPKADLVFVGPRHDQIDPGLKSYAAELASLIRQSPYRERIHFVGQVDRVEQYYALADLFVFTSKKEGMPNAVLEAMASGLPVILTPFIGLSKNFGVENKHYLLSKPTYEAIAANIINLLTNQERAGQLGSRARHLMKKNLNIKHILNKYADIYKKTAIQKGIVL